MFLSGRDCRPKVDLKKNRLKSSAYPNFGIPELEPEGNFIECGKRNSL